jgi:hypothetical protein
LTKPTPSFPSNVVAIKDTITILEDKGNHIPDKSWMMYLLECFDRRNKTPVELNLICQFNNRDNFWAIFKGTNRYKYTKVLPAVGHSYVRQIIMHKDNKSVEYSVTDQNTGETEDFGFPVNETAFAYQGANHFTGIEWWNRAGGNCLFPIRYKVKVSDLAYGLFADGSILYNPYTTLVPNSDGTGGLEYPVSFSNSEIKDSTSVGYFVAS